MLGPNSKAGSLTRAEISSDTVIGNSANPGHCFEPYRSLANGGPPVFLLINTRLDQIHTNCAAGRRGCQV